MKGVDGEGQVAVVPVVVVVMVVESVAVEGVVVPRGWGRGRMRVARNQHDAGVSP